MQTVSWGVEVSLVVVLQLFSGDGRLRADRVDRSTGRVPGRRATTAIQILLMRVVLAAHKARGRGAPSAQATSFGSSSLFRRWLCSTDRDGSGKIEGTQGPGCFLWFFRVLSVVCVAQLFCLRSVAVCVSALGCTLYSLLV